MRRAWWPRPALVNSAYVYVYVIVMDLQLQQTMSDYKTVEAHIHSTII